MADVETNVERPIPDLPSVTAPPVDNNPVILLVLRVQVGLIFDFLHLRVGG